MVRFLKKEVVAGLLGIFIVLIVLFAGPASAFVLGLTTDNANPTRGETITFTATLDISNLDKFLPVKNLTLILDGPIHTECIFDVSGNILEGCEGITIQALGGASYGYGNGSGYDSEKGVNYTFGEGYGYGYGYGYGTSQLKYLITLNTANYTKGIYETFLKSSIGKEVFSRQGESITISDPLIMLTSLSHHKSSSNNDKIRFFEEEPIKAKFIQGVDDGKKIILKVDLGKNKEKPIVFSGITSEVIGAWASPKLFFSLLFVVIIFGIFLIVIYLKR